jgi:cytochrome c oxidase subunit IV
MTKKTNYALTFLAGLLLIGLGITYQLLGAGNPEINFTFINAGTILAVIATLKYNRLGAGVTQDELTRKISARGLAYSWLLTFVAANLLYWVDYFQLVKLAVPQMLGIIIFLMALSAAIFKWALFKKGPEME